MRFPELIRKKTGKDGIDVTLVDGERGLHGNVQNPHQTDTNIGVIMMMYRTVIHGSWFLGILYCTGERRCSTGLYCLHCTPCTVTPRRMLWAR